MVSIEKNIMKLIPFFTMKIGKFFSFLPVGRIRTYIFDINLFLEPPQFFMSGNPLVCNCHLQWFHQMASAQLHHPGLMSSTSMTSMTSMNQLYPQIMGKPASEISNNA